MYHSCKVGMMKCPGIRPNDEIGIYSTENGFNLNGLDEEQGIN